VRHPFRLPRSARITRSGEIRALLRRGKRSRTAHLDVFDSASPASFPRIGVVVPRVKQPVVARNRLKRRLREVLRTEVLPRLQEAELWRDVLVRVRPEAYRAAFRDLRAELTAWAEGRCSRS
jgi:ribonuclease P protein component